MNPLVQMNKYIKYLENSLAKYRILDNPIAKKNELTTINALDHLYNKRKRLLIKYYKFGK